MKKKSIYLILLGTFIAIASKAADKGVKIVADLCLCLTAPSINNPPFISSFGSPLCQAYNTIAKPKLSHTLDTVSAHAFKMYNALTTTPETTESSTYEDSDNPNSHDKYLQEDDPIIKKILNFKNHYKNL